MAVGGGEAPETAVLLEEAVRSCVTIGFRSEAFGVGTAGAGSDRSGTGAGGVKAAVISFF